MKKTIKIFLLTIFSLILLSLFPKVEANSINSISMDIAIDDNGSVTEIWKCKTSQELKYITHIIIWEIQKYLI